MTRKEGTSWFSKLLGKSAKQQAEEQTPSLSPEEQRLHDRKNRVEGRLKSYDIPDYQVADQSYLEYETETLRPVSEAGERMFILYMVAHCSRQLEDREKLLPWLKERGLWERVSPKEKAFLNAEEPSEDACIDFAWGIESALVLGWALNLAPSLPDFDTENTGAEMRIWLDSIPKLGDDLTDFFTSLEYRSLDDIMEETLVNEMAAAYFRKMEELGEEEDSSVNPDASRQRLLALNWLRRFEGVEAWDEISKTV